MNKYGGAREATNENEIWRMRFACSTSKVTRAQAHVQALGIPPHKHAFMHAGTNARAHAQNYVILIAFPRQRASVLLYTYIVCLVTFKKYDLKLCHIQGDVCAY